MFRIFLASPDRDYLLANHWDASSAKMWAEFFEQMGHYELFK